MGIHEQWASEIEHQLRKISDASINQSVDQLVNQSQLNFPVSSLPKTSPALLSSGQQASPSRTESIYIVLTDCAQKYDVVYYSWSRVAMTQTPSGCKWIRTGEYGTYDYTPAIWINGKGLDMNRYDSLDPAIKYAAPFPDSRIKYIAKWYPGLSCYIFSSNF